MDPISGLAICLRWRRSYTSGSHARLLLVGGALSRAVYPARGGAAPWRYGGLRRLGLLSGHLGLLCPGGPFLLANAHEALGLVTLEAQAMGLPVVGYRGGGLALSVADGKTGLLTDPTPQALAEAALALHWIPAAKGDVCRGIAPTPHAIPASSSSPPCSMPTLGSLMEPPESRVRPAPGRAAGASRSVPCVPTPGGRLAHVPN